MTNPMFTDEGPQYYDAAYAHNQQFALPGPYQTQLSPEQEGSFRAWVTQYGVPFDPAAPVSDYDMRGYWLESGGAPFQGGDFPDTYKTPYDTTFSSESKYATPDNPFHWQGDNQLIDRRDGSLIFSRSANRSTAAPPASSGDRIAQQGGLADPTGYGTQWHLEADGPNGRRVVRAQMRSNGAGETHWDAELLPGESLLVIHT